MSQKYFLDKGVDFINQVSMLDRISVRNVPMTIPPRDILHELSPEIFKTLRVIFWENVYATKAIQITLKLHPEWEENKRALFSETVYDLIRWWRPLWYILDRDPYRKKKTSRNSSLSTSFPRKEISPHCKRNRGLDANQVIQRIATTKNHESSA